MDIGHGGGGGAIRIDHHDLGAAFLSRSCDVGHDVNLGGDGIAAPDHDQVGFRHLPRVQPPALPGSGDPAEFRQRRADRHFLAGVAHDIAQAIDSVPLHQPHGSREEEWPNRCGPVFLGHSREAFGHTVQCLIPADAAELAGAFGAGPQQRVHQPVRVMHPFGVTRDFGADDSGRVAVVAGAPDGADAVVAEDFHFQRAGGGAVVRADGGTEGTSVCHAGSVSRLGRGGLLWPLAFYEIRIIVGMKIHQESCR